MRVRFWYGEKPRERIFCEAFSSGVRIHGDEIDKRNLGDEVTVDDVDVAVMIGVKSIRLFQAHWRAGVHTVLVDKGYHRASLPGAGRGWIWWRVAVNGHQCTHYLMDKQFPSDRAERTGWELKRWRRAGNHILFAGSSQKYHDFVSAGKATRYAEKIIRRLSKLTDREIIYRPKPSWLDAEPVDGSTFQKEHISPWASLTDAWATVTHGSSICVESVLAGVPAIVLGDAVAKPISSTDIAEIENPRLASDEERWQWLSNLAYQQWTLHEFASGEAWQHIRPVIYGPR